MNPYSSYKDSGVEWIGEIPNDWSLKKVKYLFSTEKNQISVKEFEENEVIHYSIPNVQEFGIGQLENGNDIDSSKLLLNGNELLVSRLNPRKKTVCISELNNEHMIVGSGEFIVLVPNDMNLGYCYYQFVTGGMTQNLDSLVESVTKSHQRVRPERVFNTLYIEPPKYEIEQIVSFLDTKTQKIDELIEKTEQKIELLKEKRTSLINHCVTKGLNPDVEMKDSGVEWIGEIPKGWKVLNGSYIGLYSKGKGIKKDEVVEVGNPCVRYGEIYTKYELKIDSTFSFISDETTTNSVSVKTGTLLLTGSGETKEEIGKCIVYLGNEILWVGGDIIVLKPSEQIDSLFLSYLINSECIRVQREMSGKGEIVVHIYSKNFKEMKYPIPPLSEQTQIVEYLDEQTQKIESTIEKETQRIELLKEYRQSLISEVVTGKIDVRDWKE